MSGLHADGHDFVSVSDKEGVRYVVLNRPDKKNALTDAMWLSLAQAFETAEAAGCGALLITGNGPVFTAGNDLRDFLEHPPRNLDAPVFRFLRSLVSIEIPVVAAVRGAAVGVGATLLLHCDLVYAAPTMKLKLPFIDLGLVPEAASSLLLPRLIGRARTGAAVYLGEPIDAEQANAYNIVTKIVADEELDEVASAAARVIASKPRRAVKEAKRLMTYDKEHVLSAIEREGTAFMRQLDSEEARSVMASFFKR